MSQPQQSAGGLDVLQSLKRRAEDLSANQLEAFDLFHLSGRPGALAKLRDEQVGVGGFATFLLDDETVRDSTARESLASTARCLPSLLVCRNVKRGNADYAPRWIWSSPGTRARSSPPTASLT